MDAGRSIRPHGSPYPSSSRFFMKRTVWLLVLLAVISGSTGYVVTACYTNPATGKESLSLYSTSQEIQMGREAHEAIQAQLGFVPDSALQQYVQRVGTNLARATERTDLPWTFRVVDDPTVNAFALPGGFIYITRGMLYHMENEAEMAGVLGHEIGHVTARHSVNQMSKQQLTQIGLIGATLIEPDLQKYGQLVGAGLGLMFLKFSRDDERESDLLGLRYMYNSNYDPRYMDDVFVVLQRISEGSGSGRIPNWLSTHPAPEDRVSRIQKMVDTLPQNFEGRLVERSEYLRKLDGMVFGTDPREGYFVGTTFYHPEMRFQFNFPSGWQTVNQKQGVVGGSEQQDAILQIALAQGQSASDAARQFFTQQGITGGSPQATQINGLNAVSSNFAAQTESGQLQGTAAFVSYGDRVFQIIGYTPAAQWNAYRDNINRSIGSFARLTDQSRINVEPRRLDIVTIDRAMTIEEFNRANPSSIPLAELALINQVQTNERIPSGTQLKRVVGREPGK